MIIGVDMDEVLCESIESVLKHYNYIINGVTISKDDITNYHWREMSEFGITMMQAVELFDNVLLTDHHDFVEPVWWAYDNLFTLKQQWHQLIIITARRDLLQDNTHRWISTHYPDLFDEIYFAWHFTNKHREKSDICHELWVQIMIEDNPHYTRELVQWWIPTILLDKPWNRWQISWWDSLHLVDHRDDIPLIVEQYII